MATRLEERLTNAGREFDAKAVGEIAGTVFMIPVTKTTFKTVSVTKSQIKDYQ
jgi:hypothetical protein